jgi:hypothetical protein
MKVNDILALHQFTLLTSPTHGNPNVSGCYISDLLSWVMGHGAAGNAWITIMSHINIVAIASLLEMSCIVVSEGETPADDVLEAANSEGVVIVSTPLTSFEAARALIGLGV